MTGLLPDCGALTPDDLHVFLISTDQASPEALAFFETLLSSDELHKINRLLIPAKRIESLISRAMLRQILAHFLGKPPQQITFSITAQGKPFLENSSIRFNLSHTSGMALVAVTLDHEVGVDIECIAPASPAASTFEFETLAKRFFTPAEHVGLLAFPPAERLWAFYRCWTRKEALLKGTGAGISGLKTFEVPLHPSPSPLRLSAPLEKWTLHDLSVPAPYMASLAIDSPNPRLHPWAISARQNNPAHG